MTDTTPKSSEETPKATESMGNMSDKAKKIFVKHCHDYIKRDGLDELLAYLEETDFYIAPSSTNFHLNVEGGLCQHSINVFEIALKLSKEIITPAIEQGNSEFTKPLKEESIAIATLFHDLCKINLYHPSQRWRKDDNNRWESYQGYEIADDFPLGHGEKSCIILHSYIKLTKEELLAIRWHMGMFDMGEQGSALRYAFRNALKESPLVSIVHSADFLSSNCWEKTTNH